MVVNLGNVGNSEFLCEIDFGNFEVFMKLSYGKINRL